MSNANYKKYCWYSLAVAVAVSIYPLCMGIRVIAKNSAERSGSYRGIPEVHHSIYTDCDCSDRGRTVNSFVPKTVQEA